MTPDALTPASFSHYPPQAEQVAIRHLDLLKRLPLVVLPPILDQIIVYDWKFPAERQQLAGQIDALQNLAAEAFRKVCAPFSGITIPAPLADFDWVNQPGRFVELLTSQLWSSRQIDEYRAAAKSLLDSAPWEGVPAESRTVIFVGASDLAAQSYPLFSKMRRHGLHFQNVGAEGDLTWPLEFLAQSAAQTPNAYRHWYLDGGKALPIVAGITVVSYATLDPVRKAVLGNMDRAIRSGDGPELLHSRLARMNPEECSAPAVTPDPILQRFVTNLFTQGSGTQIYSTSFVQWTAREILRRAQPRTLVVRVAARVKQRSLNEMVAQQQGETAFDPNGSLIDADLAAYYTWLELQKLPGGGRSIFLAWFPGRGEALLAGPSVPKNVASQSRISVRQIFSLAGSA